MKYACANVTVFEYCYLGTVYLYPSICVHYSIFADMWRNQVAMVASRECLKFIAFILSSCMGFVPPKVVAMLLGHGRYIYETLARQVWHLQTLGIHINVRLYYEMVPAEFHIHARPEGLELFSTSTIEFEKRTCLIHCVHQDDEVIEIAAMSLGRLGNYNYFHRFIKYTPNSIRERMAILNYHGIPPNHATAEDYLIVRSALNKFLDDENPEVILSEQDIFSYFLCKRWTEKIEKITELA